MTLDRLESCWRYKPALTVSINGNSAKLILSEVQREHGQAAMDQLIRELNLENIFDFKPGTHFDGGLAK